MSFLYRRMVSIPDDKPPTQAASGSGSAASEAKSAGFTVVNHETMESLRLLRPRVRAQVKGRRATPSMSRSLVPALLLTTTIKKTLRWRVDMGTADWAIVFRDTELQRALAVRQSATTGVSLFSAFRLVRVDLYVVPITTGSSTSALGFAPPQLAWVTNGTTGTDTKPCDVVSAVSDEAHTSVISMSPPAKSILGFWTDVSTNTAWFTVFGKAAGATVPTAYLDVTCEWTLPDGENQPSVFNGTAFPSTSNFQQVIVAGTSTSTAFPVGYPSYQP